MQTGRRSARVRPSKLSRPPDSGKLQPWPPHVCLSRGRDPASTRREGGKSPVFVLERSWEWRGRGGLNPDLARNLSLWSVQSHQEPRSIPARSRPQVLLAGMFRGHRRTQGERALSDPQTPGATTSFPALYHCQHPRVCTLLRLLTAANFVKLLARPPLPVSFLAWPALPEAGKEKVITLESWELEPRLAGTLASGLPPGCRTAEHTSLRSLSGWGGQAYHRLSCCS